MSASEHKLEFQQLIKLILDSGQYTLDRTITSKLDKAPDADDAEEIKLTLVVKNPGYGNYPIAGGLELAGGLPPGTHSIVYRIEKAGKIDLNQLGLFQKTGG